MWTAGRSNKSRVFIHSFIHSFIFISSPRKVQVLIKKNKQKKQKNVKNATQ